jgi:hypothetical protein
MRASLRRIRKVAFLLLILTSVLIVFSFSPKVDAAVSITKMNPSSGNVGTSVELIANLTEENGGFQILFDTSLIVSGNATENIVNASFAVPEIPAGNYSITIIDITSGENESRPFEVLTSYFIQAVVPSSPKQLQENDTVPINLNITGGDASTTYSANVTVRTSTGTSFEKMLTFETSLAGSAEALLTYPDDFSTNANTHFVGDYVVFFNDTLDMDVFSVGLTNLTEYHRYEAVGVRAAYKPNENVTITLAGEDLNSSVNVTADSDGMVSYSNWTVPANASVGVYTVSVVSVSGTPTVKTPPDTQDFTVPGFTVNATAKNLAADPVPTVEIRAFEGGESVVNATTASNGLATLTLEIGNYTCEAYSRNQKVGEREVNVANVTSVEIVCNLTNLKIQTLALVNGTEVGIPEAGIFITPENETVTTDITGISIVRSLLPNVSYTLNVSRYGMPFNVTIIPQLLVNGSLAAWYNVTVFCPTLTLEVTVLKADGSPFKDSVVKVQEHLGGLEYSGSTNADGMTTFTPVFGEYDVQVYDSAGIKLNETIVNLFQNENRTISCSLYGLVFSVEVVDYFGQPISDVNVTLQGQGRETLSAKTEGDGKAIFNNVVGGSLEISVYLAGQTQPTAVQGVAVENSTTTQIKIGKYTVFAGFLVETSQLTIAVIIVLTLVVILSLEIYRMRRLNLKKSET